jgi:hypothetical protein
MRLLTFTEILEWAATFVLIIGVALTAWNIYPLNIYFSLMGNFMWLIIAFVWKKWSLISVQIIITILYVSGLINNIIN